MIEIDGNFGEGGGQIVRTALSLSALTGHPFKIYDIRKGREDPGLKNQHLHGIKALKEICNAKTDGAELGSENLTFIPSKLISKNLNIDIGTAGSITLLLQSILLPLAFADKKLKIAISGGTDTKWSPSFDYLNNVVLPHFKKFADTEIIMLNRGYYPKGHGKVELRINPKLHINNYGNFESFAENLRKDIKPITLLEQGSLLAIKGISHASKELQNAKVSERQAQSASSFLKSEFKCPIDIKSEYVDTESIGSGVTLWAIFTKTNEIDYNNPIIIGADSLGERGKKSEDVGRETALDLENEIKSGCAVDKHMADMIFPLMALLKSSSIKTSNITNHCKSNIYTIEKFFGKIFSVDEAENTINR